MKQLDFNRWFIALFAALLLLSNAAFAVGPYYVKSTTGSNGNAGTSWAAAKATLVGAIAVAAAGDTIYVSQAHAESTASSISLAFPGTDISPTNVVCANDGAGPPTATATTCTVTTTGASNITISGSVYIYGITFNVGTGSSRADFQPGTTGGNVQRFENCTVNMGTTNSSSSLYMGGGGNITPTNDFWRNVSVKFATSATRGFVGVNPFHWNTGSFVSGTSTPNPLINLYSQANSVGGVVLWENIDFSNLASTLNITIPPPVQMPVIIRNCKMPGSWSGALISTSFSNPGRIEMYNCDAGSTNYRLWIEDYYGTIRDETTIVRTGGASDGATPISWKMTGGARNAPWLGATLKSPEIVLWNASTGSSRTITVEYLHDTSSASGQGSGTGNAYQNNQIWLEVNYLGASGSPLGSLANGMPTDILTAASDNGAGVGTSGWTTTGLTTPKSGKVTATFTPQKVGFYLVRIVFGGASKIIYVDPKLVLSYCLPFAVPWRRRRTEAANDERFALRA